MSITIKTKNGDKQYSTVAERLQLLHEACKTLEVLESAPVQVGDGWIWRVLLTVDGARYVGNAEVHLNSTNFAEKADPWATAETSAVGRAIAWSGYAGTPDSIASADEVIRAQAKLPKPAQNGNSARMNALFQKGKAAGKWANAASMLEHVGQLLEVEVTPDTVGQLDAALLDLVENDIDGERF